MMTSGRMGNEKIVKQYMCVHECTCIVHKWTWSSCCSLKERDRKIDRCVTWSSTFIWLLCSFFWFSLWLFLLMWVKAAEKPKPNVCTNVPSSSVLPPPNDQVINRDIRTTAVVVPVPHFSSQFIIACVLCSGTIIIIIITSVWVHPHLLIWTNLSVCRIYFTKSTDNLLMYEYCKNNELAESYWNGRLHKMISS